MHLPIFIKEDEDVLESFGDIIVSGDNMGPDQVKTVSIYLTYSREEFKDILTYLKDYKEVI
jgi:hypothetical protein